MGVCSVPRSRLFVSPWQRLIRVRVSFGDGDRTGLECGPVLPPQLKLQLEGLALCDVDSQEMVERVVLFVKGPEDLALEAFIRFEQA